jgi:hypothetical protein
MPYNVPVVGRANYSVQQPHEELIVLVSSILGSSAPLAHRDARHMDHVEVHIEE